MSLQPGALSIPAETGLTRCTVLGDDGSVRPVADVRDISRAISREGEIVWLDVMKPTFSEMSLIQAQFDIHPVALEDARLKHERPKLDTYDNCLSLIIHNVLVNEADKLQIDEIGIFVGKDFLVTIRSRGDLQVAEIERRWKSDRDELPATSASLLYLVLDVVIDNYYPVAMSYDESIYSLEQSIFDDVDPKGSLRDVLDIKRELQRFRRSAAPLRDILLHLLRSEGHEIPKEMTAYYRDLYDHVLRVLEQIDGARIQLRGTTDVHFSWQTQKQNAVLKQLTLIATVFLPLSYMTGFFGQNFEWMTDRLKGPGEFFAFAVAAQIAVVAGLLVYFARLR